MLRLEKGRGPGLQTFGKGGRRDRRSPVLPKEAAEVSEDTCEARSPESFSAPFLGIFLMQFLRSPPERDHRCCNGGVSAASAVVVTHFLPPPPPSKYINKCGQPGWTQWLEMPSQQYPVRFGLPRDRPPGLLFDFCD